MIENISVGIPSGGPDLSFIPRDFSFNRTSHPRRLRDQLLQSEITRVPPAYRPRAV